MTDAINPTIIECSRENTTTAHAIGIEHGTPAKWTNTLNSAVFLNKGDQIKVSQASISALGNTADTIEFNGHFTPKNKSPFFDNQATITLQEYKNADGRFYDFLPAQRLVEDGGIEPVFEPETLPTNSLAPCLSLHAGHKFTRCTWKDPVTIDTNYPQNTQNLYDYKLNGFTLFKDFDIYERDVPITIPTGFTTTQQITNTITQELQKVNSIDNVSVNLNIPDGIDMTTIGVDNVPNLLTNTPHGERISTSISSNSFIPRNAVPCRPLNKTKFSTEPEQFLEGGGDGSAWNTNNDTAGVQDSRHLQPNNQIGMQKAGAEPYYWDSKYILNSQMGSIHFTDPDDRKLYKGGVSRGGGIKSSGVAQYEVVSGADSVDGDTGVYQANGTVGGVGTDCRIEVNRVAGIGITDIRLINAGGIQSDLVKEGNTLTFAGASIGFSVSNLVMLINKGGSYHTEGAYSSLSSGSQTLPISEGVKSGNGTFKYLNDLYILNPEYVKAGQDFYKAVMSRGMMGGILCSGDNDRFNEDFLADISVLDVSAIGNNALTPNMPNLTIKITADMLNGTAKSLGGTNETLGNENYVEINFTTDASTPPNIIIGDLEGVTARINNIYVGSAGQGWAQGDGIVIPHALFVGFNADVDVRLRVDNISYGLQTTNAILSGQIALEYPPIDAGNKPNPFSDQFINTTMPLPTWKKLIQLRQGTGFTITSPTYYAIGTGRPFFIVGDPVSANDVDVVGGSGTGMKVNIIGNYDGYNDGRMTINFFSSMGKGYRVGDKLTIPYIDGLENTPFITSYGSPEDFNFTLDSVDQKLVVKEYFDTQATSSYPSLDGKCVNLQGVVINSTIQDDALIEQKEQDKPPTRKMLNIDYLNPYLNVPPTVPPTLPAKSNRQFYNDFLSYYEARQLGQSIFFNNENKNMTLNNLPYLKVEVKNLTRRRIMVVVIL